MATDEAQSKRRKKQIPNTPKSTTRETPAPTFIVCAGVQVCKRVGVQVCRCVRVCVCVCGACYPELYRFGEGKGRGQKKREMGGRDGNLTNRFENTQNNTRFTKQTQCGGGRGRGVGASSSRQATHIACKSSHKRKTIEKEREREETKTKTRERENKKTQLEMKPHGRSDSSSVHSPDKKAFKELDYYAIIYSKTTLRSIKLSQTKGFQEPKVERYKNEEH